MRLCKFSLRAEDMCVLLGCRLSFRGPVTRTKICGIFRQIAQTTSWFMAKCSWYILQYIITLPSPDKKSRHLPPIDSVLETLPIQAWPENRKIYSTTSCLVCGFINHRRQLSAWVYLDKNCFQSLEDQIHHTLNFSPRLFRMLTFKAMSPVVSTVSSPRV